MPNTPSTRAGSAAAGATTRQNATADARIEQAFLMSSFRLSAINQDSNGSAYWKAFEDEPACDAFSTGGVSSAASAFVLGFRTLIEPSVSMTAAVL